MDRFDVMAEELLSRLGAAQTELAQANVIAEFLDAVVSNAEWGTLGEWVSSGMKG